MTLRRHSLRIAGHATSISIEDEFWQEITQAAKDDGISVARLVETVDRARIDNASIISDGSTPPPSLSGALRVYVLKRLQTKARD
jgi:predicted DNA-binding ribbon-helix-helix protein